MAELVSTTAPPPPAPLAPANPLEQLRGLARQPAVRRALPWFGGLAGLGAVALTWAALAPAPQRTLYAGLDDAGRAAVTASLDKAGIAWRIDADTGTLSVGEDDLYRARMLVASDGALAVPDATSALDSLPLGASRALEGERLRAAREHELMLTIQQIDGVEAVRVHLAEAERSVFVREDAPPSASVMVRMAQGRQLGDSQVAAIVNLVAGSVPGMAADAVRVVDQHGRLLSADRGANSDRLELQARLEDKLRAQLDALLTPMLGSGNFTSEVQVDLDMDQVTSARESYDKDGVIRTESQQSSQSSGSTPAGGIPGVVSNTPPPATTLRAGPPQGAAPAAAPAPVNGESSASRTYELGREVAVANSAPGKVKRLSVAVAISQAAMAKAKGSDIEQLKQLVGAATGIDPARGDQVSVMVRPFEPVPDNGLPFYETGWFAMLVRSAVALIAVVLVLVLAVRPLLAALRRQPAKADADELLVDENGERIVRPVDPAAGAVDAALLGRQVSLAQRIVDEKPEDALLALRQMLGMPAETAP